VKALRNVVVLHVLATACLGQLYAKLKLPLGVAELFPTELALVACVLVGGGAMRRVRWDRYTKLVAAFVALGVGWVIVDGLGGMDGAGAKAFSFFVYAGFFFAVRAAFRTDDERWMLLRVIAGASVVAALLGLWQMETSTPLLSTFFEETTTGSVRWLPGDYALYSLLAITIAITGPILHRRLDRTAAILIAAGAIEIVLAQHRSGFVALAVALAVTALVLGGSSGALRGLARVLVIATVALLVFVYLFGRGYLDETLSRVGTVGDTGDVNIQWRLLAWYEVSSGVIARPWGHGFSVWQFLFTSEDPLTGSHNSLLDLTYRIGVPGLLVFMAMPVRAFIDTRRLVKRDGALPHLLPITVCACLLAFLTFASFNVVFETPYMSIFFWVLMGLASGALADRDVLAAAAPTPPRVAVDPQQ
jgi:O-antigen ligase